MEFKAFILCFAFLVVATTSASVCKCGSEKKDSTSHQVSKYALKMNKDGKDYEEKIDIDTENETETFHVPKTSSDNEAGDIVYDFKKNLTMIRMPVTKSCFLSEGTENVPKPADLVKLLESKGGVALPKEQTEVKLKVIGTLDDRSRLSEEMADMCAKLPIYVVDEGELDSTDMAPAKRSKRDLIRKWVCNPVCSRSCTRICAWSCTRVCVPDCHTKCRWVVIKVAVAVATSG